MGKNLDLYTAAIHPWSERITYLSSQLYSYNYSQTTQNDPEIFTVDEYSIRIMQYFMPYSMHV